MLWDRRPPPWEPGWLLLQQGEPPLSTRSRGIWQGVCLPSTFYLHPKHLLYRPSEATPWDLMDPEAAGRRIEQLLLLPGAADGFPGALSGLQVVLRWGRAPARARVYDSGDENLAMDFGRWLVERGRAQGVRPLTADERADATGYGTFFRDLGLSGPALYDAVGTHFDPCSFMRRCYPLLQAWGAGSLPTPPAAPSPADLDRMARQLRQDIQSELPAEPLPEGAFPADVAALLRTWGMWTSPPSPFP